MISLAVQEVEKHFVQDLGARTQHEADREEWYNYGSMELWRQWKLVRFSGGCWLDDLDFELSEDMKALDGGGRHLGNHSIQHGLCEDDEEEYELDDFWMPSVVWWIPSLYVSA